MNEIVIKNSNLPATLPELSKFVLVGREKLVAVRAEIRAIDKVGLAKDVRAQKLSEAQDIADAVLDAEVKVGELTAKIPKATTAKGNQYSNKWKNDTAVEVPKSKTEVIKKAGFKPKQVQRFETLAKHPEAVEQAKAEARENEEIVTRSAVLHKIEESKKPHVANNSHDDEWYTPPEYIESARRVMGSIDLDPASNEHANKTVRASHIFTEQDNGLKHEWFGNVWLNPPYSATLISLFAEKVAKREFDQAVVLVNNATETRWFRTLVDKADAIVFKTGRVRFLKHDGERNTPLQGQAFIYYGDNASEFLDEFGLYGWGCYL